MLVEMTRLGKVIQMRIYKRNDVGVATLSEVHR